jgi:hypothetical protein
MLRRARQAEPAAPQQKPSIRLKSSRARSAQRASDGACSTSVNVATNKRAAQPQPNERQRSLALVPLALNGSAQISETLGRD